MYGIAAVLSDEDIEGYQLIVSHEKSIGTVDDKYLESEHVRKTNLEYSIQACMACHGPNGQGNSLAEFQCYLDIENIFIPNLKIFK